MPITGSTVPASEGKTLVRDDWLIVEAVRSDRGKILPGTKYIYQVSVDGGEFWIFRARPEMDAICRKYDLYPED